jgi:hypothetical protein
VTRQRTSRSEIEEWLSHFDEEFLLADGFEAAFLGVAVRCGQPPLAIYDGRRCIEILMKRDDIDLEAATAAFEFNTEGAWVGEHTPLYLWRYRG